MIRLNLMPDMSQFCPPEPVDIPLTCPYCCGDEVSAVLAPITQRPVYHAGTGETLYHCATCAEGSWQ